MVALTALRHQTVDEWGGYCEDQSKDSSIIVMRCVCYSGYGAPDCSYKKYSRALVAGLQIGLPFLAIDGVGWLVMGERQRGLAQLLMGLALWLVLIPVACVMCCCGWMKKDGNGIGVGVGVAGCLYCVATMLMIAAWAWSIADGVDMLNNVDFTDPMGFTLAP